ncbi:MAG: sigma-70 family RNA polymerase sigma factor [Gemmatimonadaceae bacterium]|nr:sigma-70 family RNA polymerase sigma factor [Gemmatimonadaceae bacterium]
MADRRDGGSSKDDSFTRDAIPWMDDVYRFALSLTREPADAQDIVQETFLRAYRSWHTFEPGSDCRRWLFTICRNAFLRMRQRTRLEVEVTDADADAVAAAREHRSMIDDGADRLLATADLGPALDRAVAELDEPFRSAVILVDLEDQSYEAAAAVLGVPIGTVRSRLFRARRQLQQRLHRFALDAGLRSAAETRRARDA